MAKDTIPTLQWLSNQIEKLDTDLLRQMLKMIAEFLMGLDADQHCGAAWAKKRSARQSPQRLSPAPMGHPGGDDSN